MSDLKAMKTDINNQAKYGEPWAKCTANSGVCPCGIIWSLAWDFPVAAILTDKDEEYTLGSGIESGSEQHREMWDRIVACVNAMAGVDSPETIIAERDEWKAIAQSYDGCLEGIALKLERKKVAELVLENRAYDLRMDNDGKRIAELKVERGEIILTLEAQDLSLAAKSVRIAELQDELSDFWWYALQKESVKKSDGWLCPYMGDGEYAGPKLVEIGQAEKHPDKDWYRHIIAAADAAESSANDEE